ncbi:MAG: hypothetical protein HY744_25490 [Deltaproteobacteria bacterium]|nr:hypothetical protein [Deltaproteobacteria bacterium]
MSTCEQACCKVEKECKLPVSCKTIGIDCKDPTMDCPSGCLLDADCQSIIKLGLQQPTDPKLTGCLAGCQTGTGGSGSSPCVQCGAGQCTQEMFACYSDKKPGGCAAFFSCIKDMQCSDQGCVQGCLTENPGGQTVIDCFCLKCGPDCGDYCAGAGGAGGAGGGQ